MNIWLICGALIMAALAGLHSYIGETRLLQPLLAKSDLPILQGSADYTKAVLRWAWHITSIAWLGFAAIFIGIAQIPLGTRPMLGVILAGCLGLSTIVAFAVTRGRHLAWIFFLVAMLCVLLGTM